jgi:glycosyltransferase involved in cell wall biosynthesis
MNDYAIKLSIIIPHYNDVVLLEKLLASIPAKKDLEVIVIDDKSGKKEFEQYNKLKNNNKFNHTNFMVNKTNKKGAGVCRNIGLDSASGEWVLFADSDDYFVNGFYNKISKYFDSNYEVVFFPPTSIYIDSGEEAERHKKFVEVLNNYLEIKSKKNELYLRYSIANPISKLIKRKFIENNKLQFDEVIASNDVMFSTKVGYYMDQFKVDTEIIYCITRNKGSLTVTRSEEVFDSRLSVYINKINFLRERLPKEKMKYFSLTGQGFIFNSIKYKFGLKKVLDVIQKFRKNNIPLFNKNVLNPIYLFEKLRNHYFIEKNSKKYISK